MPVKVCFLVAVLALLGGLVACGSDGPSADTEVTDLYNRSFSVVAVEEGGVGRPLIGPVKLSFNDGRRMDLSTDCNGASVRLDGITKTKLETSGSWSHLMGCEDDLAAQDRLLTGLLTSRPEWQLEGPNLQLSSGEVVVTLEESNNTRPPSQG